MNNEFLKENSGTILTIISLVGLAATTYFTVKATKKVQKKLAQLNEEKAEEEITKKDIVKTILPDSAPAIASGIITTAAIIGSNVENKKAYNALAATTALVTSQFKEYRNVLIEKEGKEKDEEIRTECVHRNAEVCNFNPDVPDKKMIFKEPILGYEFEAYERDVIEAEYHLNRNYIFGGFSTLYDFYKFLNIEFKNDKDQQKAMELGWDVCDGIMFLDFEHRNKGNKIMVCPVFEPDIHDDYI